MTREGCSGIFGSCAWEPSVYHVPSTPGAYPIQELESEVSTRSFADESKTGRYLAAYRRHPKVSEGLRKWSGIVSGMFGVRVLSGVSKSRSDESYR